MATGTYAPDPFEQYCDDDGNPLSSGSLTTYAAGTSTPVTTYSDVNLTIANTNPISLDAAGRPTSGAIFLTPGTSYKFVLMDVLGATVATRDNIAAVPLNPNVTGTWTPVIGGATSTSGQTYAFQQGTYTKLGTLVIASYEASLTNKGTIVGGLQIQGFPFINASIGTYMNIGGWSGSVLNFYSLVALLTAGTSFASIIGMTVANTSNVFYQPVTTDISNAFTVVGQMIYTTSS